MNESGSMGRGIVETPVENWEDSAIPAPVEVGDAFTDASMGSDAERGHLEGTGGAPGSASPDQVQTQAPESVSADDLLHALARLRKLYPEAASEPLPPEVLHTYRAGGDIVGAYAAYKSKADAQALAALRAENEALKKSQASAQRAPVRGVAGGGVEAKAEDPFLIGFQRSARGEW